jgi:hypothetical protein
LADAGTAQAAKRAARTSNPHAADSSRIAPTRQDLLPLGADASQDKSACLINIVSGVSRCDDRDPRIIGEQRRFFELALVSDETICFVSAMICA